MKRIDDILSSGKVPIAAVYARYSSDNQREESIDAQLRACREYAAKNRLKIVAEYVDKAKSATSTDNRSEFLNMIRDSEKFDFVLVHKLDRFARNRSDSIGYRMELKRHNTTLISVLENLDEDNPESIILESVLEGMNEYYSKNLAREVRKGLNENALRCIHNGGLPPLGYVVNQTTKKLEIDNEEALAVKLIFQCVLDGMGYSYIIQQLNQRGIKTKRGKSFGKNSIYEILHNEKYCGVYVYNRSQSKINHCRNSHKSKSDDEIIRIEGGVPAIINKEEFQKVQEILGKRANKVSSKKAKEIYLLSGKIYCGECGAVYCGNRHNCGRSKTTMVTYRCNNRVGKTSVECKNKEVNKKYLESFVLKVLSEIIFDEKYIPNIISQYNDYSLKNSSYLQDDINRIEKEISRLNKKIGNVTSVIAETGNATLVEALANFENERNNLTELLSETKERMKAIKIPDEEINAAFNKAKLMFESGKLAETKQIINLYVERIDVYPDRVDLKINPINFVSQYISAGDNAELSKIPSDNFSAEKSVTRRTLNERKSSDK